jgi:hypothetical protein
MLILVDHVTPAGIARFLPGHTVTKAKDRGWDTLTNGDLLAEAERAGFDVLLTADKNMRHQQNLRPDRDIPTTRSGTARAGCVVNQTSPSGSSRQCRRALGAEELRDLVPPRGLFVNLLRCRTWAHQRGEMAIRMGEDDEFQTTGSALQLLRNRI